MSDRVYMSKATTEYLEDHPYAKRDMYYIRDKVEALVDKIRADIEAKKEGLSWCDHIEYTADGKVASVNKSVFSLSAKDYPYTNNAGEQKMASSYSVNFVPKDTEGFRVSFFPKVFGQKLSFGPGIIYLSDYDDATAQWLEAKPLTDRQAGLTAQLTELATFPDSEGLINLIGYFTELENVKEEQLPHGRAAGNRKPVFYAKSVQEVMDDIADGGGRFGADYAAAVQNGVLKAEPFAEAMAKALDDADAWIKVERESKDKDENGETKKYMAPCSLRICVERRMVVQRDEAGNIIKKKDKDGKEKAVMSPVSDDNGKPVYNTYIDVTGTGIRYDLDVSGDTAKVLGIAQEVWFGNQCDRRNGFSKVMEKATDEVKAFVHAVDTITSGSRTNSPMFEAYLRIRDAVAAKSDVALDDNGNPRLDKNGNPLKEEYASWKKEYRNEQNGHVIPGHPVINLRNGDHGAVIDITADQDYPDVLRAAFLDFAKEGEKPARTMLNNEETTKKALELCRAGYLYDILAKEVPSCAEPKRTRSEVEDPRNDD